MLSAMSVVINRIFSRMQIHKEHQHMLGKEPFHVYIPNYNKNALSNKYNHLITASTRGSSFAVVASPVVLLLDGGGQLLVIALQVCEAHQQRVSLWSDQLLGFLDILDLPIAGLKPVHG